MAEQTQKRPSVVLAVDDKSDSSAVISRALRTRSDLRTLVAYSGAEVISLLQAVAIDVIVVGHPLQEASAIELLDRAAYLGRRPASIIITAEPRAAAVLEAQERGVVHFIISKPACAEDLLLAIDFVLRDRVETC